jgi:hypothetical protein
MSRRGRDPKVLRITTTYVQKVNAAQYFSFRLLETLINLYQSKSAFVIFI